MESGDFLLLESGFKILLETSVPPVPVVVTTVKRTAAWFGIPAMRQQILQPKKKVFLNEVISSLRNG